MAITHSLPLSQWYTDETSQWTLDYPPFFAYFEFALSHVAKYFDAQMLVVENLNYASGSTIIFQRLSVMAGDIVYGIGLQRYIYGAHWFVHHKIVYTFLFSCFNLMVKPSTKRATLLWIALTVGNVSLFIVDHIHFQYNGLLFGILLCSVAKVRQEKFLQAAFLFAVLLNMKHIFVYVAPAFIVYLAKYYCLRQRKRWQQLFALAKLGIVVLTVTAISFGPFYGQIPQVLARLFPFKRGLCHAYWAPNFWALYNALDFALAKFAFGSKANCEYTHGLVQDFQHQVLPSVHPIATFVLTFLMQLPHLVILCYRKYDVKESPRTLLRLISLTACSAFLFGWHVHEKAILMVLIPVR